MSSLEVQEQSSKFPSSVSDSVGGKLLADVHGWFEHQSLAAKSAEVIGAVAIGAVAVALTRGRLHSLEAVAKSTSLDGALTEFERQAAFASKEYLSKAYLLSPKLEQTMEKLAKDLTTKYPELNSVIVADGQSNGSFVLRSLFKAHPASDLDFYLVGHTTTVERLHQISKDVQFAVKDSKLTADGVLNGKNPEIYLNLDRLPEHIANEDFNLLKLPFEASYGGTREAQLAVIKSVISHPEKDVIWQKIVDVHAQPLSMHHGSWSLDFNNAIMHDYMPQKIEKFGLPKSPELLLKSLTKRAASLVLKGGQG
jgi:hypothetical protein